MATHTIVLEPSAANLPSSNYPEVVLNIGTNFPILGLAFDADSDEECYWQFRPPKLGLNMEGTLPEAPMVNILWYADTASSGVVAIEHGFAAITPNADTQDVETKAFDTLDLSSDTHLGTTGQRLHLYSRNMFNYWDSMTGDDWVTYKFIRKGTNAGDTMTGDAIITQVYLTYTDT